MKLLVGFFPLALASAFAVAGSTGSFRFTFTVKRFERTRLLHRLLLTCSQSCCSPYHIFPQLGSFTCELHDHNCQQNCPTFCPVHQLLIRRADGRIAGFASDPYWLSSIPVFPQTAYCWGSILEKQSRPH